MGCKAGIGLLVASAAGAWALLGREHVGAPRAARAARADALPEGG